MVGGKGVAFPAPMRNSTGLYVILAADAGSRGGAASSRIHSACEVTIDELVAVHPDLMSRRVRAVFNPKTETVASWEETCFVDLVIDEKPASSPDPEAPARVLATAAAERFASVFTPDDAAMQLLDKIRFAARIFPEKHLPDVSDAGLIARLPALCFGLQRLEAVRRIDWRHVISTELDYPVRTWLDTAFPDRISVPSGSLISVNYKDAAKPDGAPHMACRIQELFGLLETPRIAEGRVPVVLHLLAPNMRPCQVTTDLKSFWQNTYKDVRKDLKGRYPKHYWPENPYEAAATSRVRGPRDRTR